MNTLPFDFSKQISAIDIELNSSDINQSILKLLIQVKEIISSVTESQSNESFNKILSQLNTSMLHLTSIGYAGTAVPNLINLIQNFLNKNLAENLFKNNDNSLDNHPTFTKEIKEIVNLAVRNNIDEITNRIVQEISNKFSLIINQQSDNYIKSINESLHNVSLDIIKQISTPINAMIDSEHPTKQLSYNTLNLNHTDINDTIKTFADSVKIVQKNSKEISEQSNFINNISQDINSSISKFKKSLNLKNFISTILFAWIISAIGGYFILNNITKIERYKQEHEAIQNLKIIKQNLDIDGLKCWNKIFNNNQNK